MRNPERVDRFRFLRVPSVPAPLRYAFAPAATLLVGAIQHALLPTPAIAPFVFFFLAVVVTSWIMGTLPGLLAVALSAMVGNYFVIAPQQAWSLSAQALTATAMFVASASAVAVIGGAIRGAMLEVQLSLDEQQRARGALRHSEEGLRMANQRMASLLENSPLAVIEWTPEFRVSRWSEEATRLFGWTAEEILGRQLEELQLVHPEDWSQVRRVMAEMFGKCARTVSKNRNIRKGGAVLHCEWYNSVVADSSGKLASVLSLVLDVTERERLIEALRESDQRKSQFLAMLSHELRNPLAPIRNSLLILDRAVPGGEQAGRAKAVIDRQVAQLTRLVDDLLDVTRITHGKLQIQRRPLELGELVRRTAEDHRSAMVARGLSFRVDLAPRPLCVNGDSARLAQAIGNLLSNAEKFSRQQGHVRVGLREDAARGEAVISVRDDGIGIDGDLLARIFRPFEQAERALDRSKGGLGLGLAIVRGLVEQHGGNVEGHSDGPDRGATFTVRLPLERHETASVPSTTAAKARARHRVLVIEDNADAANSLGEVLRFREDQVEIAHDGAEGIRKAREFRPDVVLCDIGLPEMDGYALARAFRSEGALRSTYLVALTGYALPEDVARAKDAGFDLHVAKPPSIESLERIFASAPTGARP